MGHPQLKPAPNVPALRQEFARTVLNIEGTGLEFGGYDRPLFDPKTVNLKFLDYYSTAELRDFAARDGVNPEAIAEVDYVVKDLSFAAQVNERFDFLVASHVIEHIPDVITWLENAAEILRPSGRLFLIVPDKRYTFDAIRPLTTLEEVITSHKLKRSCPSFEAVFDNLYLFRTVDAAAAWAGKADPVNEPGRFDVPTALRHAFDYYERQDRSIHCQVFTSESFLKIIDELSERGAIRFKCVGFQDVFEMGNEFYVALEKIG